MKSLHWLWGFVFWSSSCNSPNCNCYKHQLGIHWNRCHTYVLIRGIWIWHSAWAGETMSLIQSNIWITPNHYGNRSGYQCCYTNFQYPGIHPCSRCSQCTITRHSTCMDSQHPDCWNSVCHDSILMFKVSTRVVACKHDFFTYHDIASSCCDGKATSALHLCTASALSWLLCASLQANKILLIRGLGLVRLGVELVEFEACSCHAPASAQDGPSLRANERRALFIPCTVFCSPWYTCQAFS